jgi:hypothetical protein
MRPLLLLLLRLLLLLPQMLQLVLLSLPLQSTIMDAQRIPDIVFLVLTDYNEK